VRNREKEQQDQQWFDEQLRGPVEQLDSLHKPSVPELYMLESLVETHKQTIRRKQLRELAWLWIAGCFIFSLMMWLVNTSIGWFIGMQITVASGALLFACASFGRGLNRRWRS